MLTDVNFSQSRSKRRRMEQKEAVGHLPKNPPKIIKGQQLSHKGTQNYGLSMKDKQICYAFVLLETNPGSTWH